jgi:hypothetical protein
MASQAASGSFDVLHLLYFCFLDGYDFWGEVLKILPDCVMKWDWNRRASVSLQHSLCDRWLFILDSVLANSIAHIKVCY